jgi:uroporphyrinogen III methyltransferase/synthase
MIEQPGKVFLVGSGLGGESYLTVQARQVLAMAEVLLYDALIDSDLLSLAPESCLKLDVGKRGGQSSMAQKEINRLLVQHCQAGKLVVRLKSGDPFVFGRGQAELRALRTEHCAVEIVPGLSSALTAPALVGIPLTDPTMSRSFVVLTAHEPDNLNWRSLADLETLVILMGGSTLPEVLRRLQGHGRSPQTPIAVIRWAGRPQQQVWEGTLADILAKTEGESLSPCVIVIGEVVRLRHYLNFVPPQPTDQPNSVLDEPALASPLSQSEPLSSKPDVPMIATNRSDLTGKTILVTRATTQASQFLDRLAETGAIAIEMPALEIVPPSNWEGLDREIARLPQYDWLILTSANAVESFFERLQTLRGSMRLPARLQLAVVGDKTAIALKQVGFDPDFVPPEFVSDSMAAYFPGGLEGSRVLFPRVESGGRDLLVRDLTAKGASVVEVAAYQSRCPDAIAPDALAALQTRRVDAITFASSKTVKHFCQMLERSQPNSAWQAWLENVCIASIGPQTSKACEDFLGRIDAEAREYNLDGLIQAMEDWFAAHSARSTRPAVPDIIDSEVVELDETDVVEIFDFESEPMPTASEETVDLQGMALDEPIQPPQATEQPPSSEVVSPVSVLKGRDLLSMADLSATELRDLLQLAADLKAGKFSPKTQKTLGLLFYKASTRTRVSFSAAMYRLGGQVLDLNPNVTQVSRGEPLADTARVLDRYLDILAIRTFEQKDLEIFAEYCQIPVINALTDLEHPCQVLADLQTAQEVFGELAGLTLAYVGDGNNMANSLLLGCALSEMNIRIASPEGYQPAHEIVEKAREIVGDRAEITITTDPYTAVKDAQVVYTDVWASMGQEGEAESRMQAFQAFRVNSELMANADSRAIVLHCLPAHRGEEITEDVMEGTQSRIWDQAENRMHAQQALIASLLGLV